MTTIPGTTVTPTIKVYGPDEPTAADLRVMADMLDLVGTKVRLRNASGATCIVGVLTSVYFTDGPAVNIVGERSGDFSFGPLYGGTVEAVE